MSNKRVSTFSVTLFAISLLSASAMAGPPAQVDIPKLSEWGFIIMGICLLSLGVRALLGRDLSDSR